MNFGQFVQRVFTSVTGEHAHPATASAPDLGARFAPALTMTRTGEAAGVSVRVPAVTVAGAGDAKSTPRGVNFDDLLRALGGEG